MLVAVSLTCPCYVLDIGVWGLERVQELQRKLQGWKFQALLILMTQILNKCEWQGQLEEQKQ